VDYTEPDIKWTMVGTSGGVDPDTGDIYRGFDRFGRIKDNYWYDYGTSTDVDRIKYGYDRNGNRTYRENTVAASFGKYFDELYNYDLIDRLATMDRGELDNLKSQIQNLEFAQDWALDATGNWSGFKEDDDGSSTWDLNQQRTSNKVNEITDITESTGPSWVTPVYSKAGNMTTIPQPADPTKSYTASYDAWNRLVQLLDGSDTVAAHEYDGAKRRTIKKSYTGGVLDETRHHYYTEPSKWQVIEERIDSSTNAERQFVWGLRYIDDLILRDRDTTADGSLDERLYGTQDANWNTAAIVDSTSHIQERYGYSAFGSARVFDATFTPIAGSAFNWEALFASYRLDTGSGIHFVRNRAYTPTLGWLQRDALGYGDGPNLYSYLRNSPLNWTDPFGLLAETRLCTGLLAHPCRGRWATCICGLIGLIDTGVGVLAVLTTFGGPARVIIEIINIFTSILDCVCDIANVLTVFCLDEKERKCDFGLGVTISLGSAAISCAADFFGSAVLSWQGLAGIGGPADMFDAVNSLAEMFSFIWGQLGGPIAGVQSSWQACASLISNPCNPFE